MTGMGYSPTRSSPRASWTGWSTAPITCSCRSRATAPTSAPAPTGPTRHKEVAQARTLPVGVSDSLIDPLVNSLIVHTARRRGALASWGERGGGGLPPQPRHPGLVGLLPERGVQQGVHQAGPLRVAAHLSVGAAHASEQVEG